MPKTSPPECVDDAFELYLKYKGQRFDLIEKEMRLKGWVFNKQCLKNRGEGKNFREGWIEKYRWEKALEIYLTAKNTSLLTDGERLFQEIETIRVKLFDRIQSSGVDNRDLVWQHEKYCQRSTELLVQIEQARNPLKTFALFWKFLVTASLSISPNLARELVNAEEIILKLAKDEFGKPK